MDSSISVAKLSDAQKKFHPIERSCLAVLLALERFRIYFHGNPITVVTDNSSLNWLKNCADPTGRMARWSLRLQAFDFTLKHKKLSENSPVCLLSREMDVDTTPEIEFQIDSCELLAPSVEWAYKSNHTGSVVTYPDTSSLELIDVTVETQSKDDWYIQKYDEISSGLPSDNYKIDNNLLYFRYGKLRNPFEREWKICVPIEDYDKVFVEQHSDTLASHPGFYRTTRRIQENYYWPNMIKSIYNFVSKCEICRMSKPFNTNTHTTIGKRRETDFPIRKLAADFIGPTTLTERQNQYLFVVVDNFSKFIFLAPMRNAKTANVTKFIEENIFLQFGVCEKFICDNGVQFIANEFKKFMGDYHVDIQYTPLYHPQANPCEIANKSIVNAMRAYVLENDSQRVWDENISSIACALNNTVHTSIHITPFYAVFGHNMILDGREYTALVDMNDDELPSNDKREVLITHIKERLSKAYERIRKNHNRNANERELDVNKKTYLVNKKLSNAGERYAKKLGKKYIPVKITKKIGSNTYAIEDENGKFLGNYHAKLLIQFSEKEKK